MAVAKDKAGGPTWQTVAGQLRQRMAELGLKQKDVAEMAGVTPATVSRWLSGQRFPSNRPGTPSITDVLKIEPAQFKLAITADIVRADKAGGPDVVLPVDEIDWNPRREGHGWQGSFASAPPMASRHDELEHRSRFDPLFWASFAAAHPAFEEVAEATQARGKNAGWTEEQTWRVLNIAAKHLPRFYGGVTYTHADVRRAVERGVAIVIEGRDPDDEPALPPKVPERAAPDLPPPAPRLTMKEKAARMAETKKGGRR